MSTHIVFAPLIPWPMLACLKRARFGCLHRFPRRALRGSILRLCGFLLLAAVLAGPRWTTHTATPLPDIALILVDQSAIHGYRQPQRHGDKRALRLARQRGQYPTRHCRHPPRRYRRNQPAPRPSRRPKPTSSRTSAPASSSLPTAKFQTLPPCRAIHPSPHSSPPRARRQIASSACSTPRLSGWSAKIRPSRLDRPRPRRGRCRRHRNRSPSRRTAQRIATQQVIIGQPSAISLPIRHAGPAIITASVSPLPGEISPINDQTAFTLTGIHKRLNVLFISGSPNPGERAWRLLLKSDPAVQLVHFTILRTPGRADRRRARRTSHWFPSRSANYSRPTSRNSTSSSSMASTPQGCCLRTISPTSPPMCRTAARS